MVCSPMTSAVLHRFLYQKVDFSQCSTLVLFTNDTPYNNNMFVYQIGEKNYDFWGSWLITNKKSIVYVILHNYIVEIQLCNNNSFFCLIMSTISFFFSSHFQEKKSIMPEVYQPCWEIYILLFVIKQDRIQYKENDHSSLMIKWSTKCIYHSYEIVWLWRSVAPWMEDRIKWWFHLIIESPSQA